MQAQIGDYVRKDGAVTQVVGFDGDPAHPPFGYQTADGGCIGNDELGPDDVLLPSEAEALQRG